MNIHSAVERLQSKMVDFRRDFHQHPELGFTEFRTSKVIANILKNMGFDVQTEVGQTGIVADLYCGAGPVVALRADMDALPIQETSDVPYKSVNDGIMHACGHDAHMAMLLGAAEALYTIQSDLTGTVRFIFQPAEEGGGGARYMIADGCLKNVEDIYGIHVWNYQSMGEVGVKPGPILAAADKFTISIKGIGGHGAAPQGSVDAVVVSAQLITALQTIVSRNTNPLESTVLTVGTINGGSNFNIIADEVVLKGTARAYTEENRTLIKKRMADIIDGIEKTFNAEIQFDYEDGYPPTINDERTYQICLESAKRVVGENAGKPYLSMGGEDFSYYAREIPGCFFFVGSAPPGRELLSVPHHCSHFDIDERVLSVGASVFVEIILSRMGK